MIIKGCINTDFNLQTFENIYKAITEKDKNNLIVLKLWFFFNILFFINFSYAVIPNKLYQLSDNI